jgi:hypothetical protein
MDVLKLTMPEIRALSLHYFHTEIPKGNKEMVVRAFAVLMEKSPGVVTVIYLLLASHLKRSPKLTLTRMRRTTITQVSSLFT